MQSFYSMLISRAAMLNSWGSRSFCCFPSWIGLHCGISDCLVGRELRKSDFGAVMERIFSLYPNWWINWQILWWLWGKTATIRRVEGQVKEKAEVTFTSREAPLCHQACCQVRSPSCSLTVCRAARTPAVLRLRPIPRSFRAPGACCSWRGGSPLPVHWLWLPGRWYRWGLGFSDPSSGHWLHERIEDL